VGPTSWKWLCQTQPLPPFRVMLRKPSSSSARANRRFPASTGANGVDDHRSGSGVSDLGRDGRGLGGGKGEHDDLCALRRGGVARSGLRAHLGGDGLGLLRVRGADDDVVTGRDGGPAVPATHVARSDDCDAHRDSKIVDGSEIEHEGEATP